MYARLPLRDTAITSAALVVAAMLILAGCGVSQAPPAGDVTAAPTPRTARATPTTGLPTPGRNTPTVTSGTSVTIATDSQSYRTGDTIYVSITNHLRTPVYAVGGKVNCTVVEAEMKTGQGWQKASIAPCGDAEMRDLVQIAPGATRTVTLAAAGAVAFSPGTYRLALSYSTYSIPPQMSAPINSGFSQSGSLAHAKSSPLETVYSQAFAVQ